MFASILFFISSKKTSINKPFLFCLSTVINILIFKQSKFTSFYVCQYPMLQFYTWVALKVNATKLFTRSVLFTIKLNEIWNVWTEIDPLQLFCISDKKLYSINYIRVQVLTSIMDSHVHALERTQLGTVHLIFWGAWDILEINFLARILTNKKNLLNGTVKKIICLQ